MVAEVCCHPYLNITACKFKSSEKHIWYENVLSLHRFAAPVRLLTNLGEELCIIVTKSPRLEKGPQASKTDERGCSSVVERMLCMYEAPSSILGISTYFTSLFPTELFD